MPLLPLSTVLFTSGIFLAALFLPQEYFAMFSSFSSVMQHQQFLSLSASVLIVLISYLLFKSWQVRQREKRVKSDKLYLSRVKSYLLSVPAGSWFEDNSTGCVDASRNRHWIHWRVLQDPMGQENYWNNAKKIKDAGADVIVNQIIGDIDSAKVIGKGYGLNDHERTNLNMASDGLAMVYYDLSVEIEAMKVHLDKFLTGIVGETYQYRHYRHLERGVISAGIPIHQGLSQTVIYLNECSEPQIEAIKTAYKTNNFVETNSYWHKQELVNCEFAIQTYFNLLQSYVRLYTLRQIVAGQIPVGQRKKPHPSLFSSKVAIPPYSFIR